MGLGTNSFGPSIVTLICSSAVAIRSPRLSSFIHLVGTTRGKVHGPTTRLCHKSGIWQSSSRTILFPIGPQNPVDTISNLASTSF